MRGRVFVSASDNIYNRVQWPPPRSDCLQTQRPLYTPSQHTHLLWQCTTFFSVIPNEEFQLMLQLIFTTMGSTLLPLPIPRIKISTCPGWKVIYITQTPPGLSVSGVVWCLDIWDDMSSVMGGVTKNATIVTPDILDVSERAAQL